MRFAYLHKFPCAGTRCMFINTVTFCLCFHTIAVKSHFTIVFISPWYSQSFFPKSLGITFQFRLTVLQQFMVFLRKLSIKLGEEINILVQFMSQMFSKCVTVASVAAIVALTLFLSLPKFINMLWCLSLRISQLIDFYPKTLVFFSCLKMALTLKRYVTSLIDVFSFAVIFSINITELIKSSFHFPQPVIIFICLIRFIFVVSEMYKSQYVECRLIVFLWNAIRNLLVWTYNIWVSLFCTITDRNKCISCIVVSSSGERLSLSLF
jgi:hypothetical protein